ncbi:MAG: hypothetical protein ACREGF_01235 [Candidatus Saccharimonadales bacterium]
MARPLKEQLKEYIRTLRPDLTDITYENMREYAPMFYRIRDVKIKASAQNRAIIKRHKKQQLKQELKQSESLRG